MNQLAQDTHHSSSMSDATGRRVGVRDMDWSTGFVEAPTFEFSAPIYYTLMRYFFCIYVAQNGRRLECLPSGPTAVLPKVW